MLPILLEVGPVKIYSMGVLLAIGIFLSLYWWWKMGRDEHLDEISLFDSYFLMLLIFGIVGRLVYVGSHFADLGTLYRTLAILAFPGINVWGGLVGVLIFLFLFARERGWDTWKMIDMGVVVVAVAMIFGSIGGILNGSGENIWVDVGYFVWSLGMFAVCSRVRKNFRFYAWYKGEASVAREGLAGLIFGLGVGMWNVGLSFLLDWGKVSWLHLTGGVGVSLMFGYWIYSRIGRRTPWQNLLQWISKKSN